MNSQERRARIKLAMSQGVGPKTFRQILGEYGEVGRFLDDPFETKSGIVNKEVIVSLKKKCDDFDIEDFLAKLEASDIKVVVYGQEQYPQSLKFISFAPPILFYKGDISLLSSNCFSVVGTRSNTSYGRWVTHDIVSDLVRSRFTIVSGMAFGIDSIAHRACLEAGGKTIAVLAGPVDKPSPMSNWKTYELILEEGLVISEYPPGYRIHSGNFVQRNRIIAGLSLGTLVTEASRESGALITAEIAFGEGRMVFAVPGDINKQASAGANNLIKRNKAKLVTDAGDILEEFGFVKVESDQRKENISGIEAKIVSNLVKEPLSEDGLTRKFDIDTKSLLASLTSLEIKGIIKRGDNGKFYVTN